MRIETLKITDLIPYENNARSHPKKQIDLLAKNIEKFGFTVPVIIDKDNNVIAGHGRLLAFEQLKIDEVPCVRMAKLTKKEVKALRLADNRITQMSDDNMELVMEELKGLDDDMLDLTGFDRDNIELEPDMQSGGLPRKNVSFQADQCKTCPKCGHEF